jgi:hypothetical protein
VAPHRDPTPRGRQIRFGADRVLPVTEVIADICQHFHQRDPDIRRVAIGPLGQQRREPIEHHAPETGEVARQVVDLDVGERRRRT